MKSWEVALNDLKGYAAFHRAGKVDELRSIEIAGGLVRDYTSGLEEQFDALHAAATEMADFLWHEKESDEPPRALLDKGYVSMVRSDAYEREEKLGEKLLTALGRDPNETSSPAWKYGDPIKATMTVSNPASGSDDA